MIDFMPIILLLMLRYMPLTFSPPPLMLIIFLATFHFHCSLLAFFR